MDKLIINEEVYTWDEIKNERIHLASRPGVPTNNAACSSNLRLRKHIKMLHFNSRSVVNKSEEIEQTLLENEPHVATITQTWLKSDVSENDIFPPKYYVL